MWYLMIIMAVGTLAPSINTIQLEFANKEACMRATDTIAPTKSDRLAVLCINKETGEAWRK